MLAFEFCMETRLFNIFKSTNVTKLIKVILESSYRVLQVICKWKTLKQHIYFLKAAEFWPALTGFYNLYVNGNPKATHLLFKGSWILTYFSHSNWHNFGCVVGKAAKPHFLKTRQKPLKTRQHSYHFSRNCGKCCRKTISSPFSKKSKLIIFLDQ